MLPGTKMDCMSSPQEKSAQNQTGVKPWTSVRQTITADHHLNPIRSAAEQMRWPTLTPPETSSQKECE